MIRELYTTGGFMVYNLSSLLSICNLIYIISNKIKIAQSKKRFRSEVFSIFEVDVNNFMKAYDNFLLDCYAITGAYLLGLVLNPSDTEYVSKTLFERLDKSYSSLENSLIQVINTMRLFKDDFILIYGKNEKQLVLYKTLTGIIDENKKIDFMFVASKEHYFKKYAKIKKTRNFYDNLVDKQGKCSCLAMINDLDIFQDIGNKVMKLRDDPQLNEILIKYK